MHVSSNYKQVRGKLTTLAARAATSRSSGSAASEALTEIRTALENRVSSCLQSVMSCLRMARVMSNELLQKKKISGPEACSKSFQHSRSRLYVSTASTSSFLGRSPVEYIGEFGEFPRPVGGIVGQFGKLLGIRLKFRGSCKRVGWITGQYEFEMVGL
jgi:hypothetical protein